MLFLFPHSFVYIFNPHKTLIIISSMDRPRQRRCQCLFAAFLPLFLLQPPLVHAYTPGTKPWSLIVASKAPTTAKLPSKASMSSSSGKPNPLSTLLEVYTRDDSSRESVQISPEEARLKKDRQYTLLTGLPLKPYFERRTVRTQVAENIWTFEQPQGFFNVTTPIRMTVIRLADGRLWVHAPVAATRECRRLLDELGGEIAYIILPTTAFEHKVFVGGFARAYPKAKVWVCPGQWAWPVNLPPPFRVDGYLSDDDDSSRSRKPMPWANEIEQFVLQPPCIGIGPANEVVFFHKSTKTLLVTDLVVYIDGQSPSPVVDIPDLLKASYDDPDAVPSNTPVPPNTEANRRKGWARMALQILFLGPTRFSTFKLVERRLLVSPVIETFVYSKVPEALVEFVERVALRWKFTSIIPAHFNAPAPASPRALQRAFAFAYDLTGRTPEKLGGGDRGGYSPLLEFWERVVGGGGREGGGSATKYPEDDMAVLRFVNGFILKAGIARK